MPPPTLLPYSVHTFNNLPSLDTASTFFTSNHAEPFVLHILRVLQPLLLSHNMHATFGVQLLHNHFPLTECQKLVSLNDQATAWTLPDGDEDSILGGRIVPVSWRIVRGRGMMAYDFEFEALNEDKEGIDLADERYAAFLADFVGCVECAGLRDCVGLTKRGERPGGLEIPQERTNVFLPSGTYRLPDKVEGVAEEVVEGEAVVTRTYWGAHRQLNDEAEETTEKSTGEPSVVARDRWRLHQQVNGNSKETGTLTTEEPSVVTRTCWGAYPQLNTKAKDPTEDPIGDPPVITRDCWGLHRQSNMEPKTPNRGITTEDSPVVTRTCWSLHRQLSDEAREPVDQSTEDPFVTTRTCWGAHGQLNGEANEFVEKCVASVGSERTSGRQTGSEEGKEAGVGRPYSSWV